MSLLELPIELLLEIKDQLDPASLLLWRQACVAIYQLLKNLTFEETEVRISALKHGSVLVLSLFHQLGMKFTSKDLSKYICCESLDAIQWLTNHLGAPLQPLDKAYFVGRVIGHSSSLECIKFALTLSPQPYSIYILIGLYRRPEILREVGIDKMEVIQRANPTAIGKFGNLVLLRDCQEHRSFSQEDYEIMAKCIIQRSAQYYDILDHLLDGGYIKIEYCSELVNVAIKMVNLDGLKYCLKRKIHPNLEQPRNAFNMVILVNNRTVIEMTELLIVQGLQIPTHLFELFNWKKCVNINVIKYLLSKGVRPHTGLLQHAKRIQDRKLISKLKRLDF